MKAKKKTLREEIEYRLGMYFGLRSGALYVRDEKFGNQDQIMKQLESDVTQDVKFLAKKELDKSLASDLSFRDVALFYKNYLMKK
ncbi:hypothetical protein [Bacteroides cellulosilyticus]|uniref:hypothetical protein n=1 Tax=Bacteroides cellulosilyticus TaxID=246787 RepID=UPI0032EC9DB5